jgi:hypothetical protein
MNAGDNFIYYIMEYTFSNFMSCGVDWEPFRFKLL